MIKASVTGNIGKEIKMLEKGERILYTFSIASSNKQKDGTQVTTWVSCATYENCSQIQKGAFVTVTGFLTLSEYQGKSQLKLWINEPIKVFPKKTVDNDDFVF